MRQMRLRYIADVRNSNVDKVIVDGEHPVRLCNYVDVYKNDFITSNMEFSAGSATAPEIASFALRKGDVIITKDSEDRSDIGVPALVRSTAPDLVCGYHLSMLRAKPGVAIGPFLFWALLSKPAREAFSNAAYGITRYGMTLGGMKDVLLPLPDLVSQKAIADFLDRETARINQLIEKKQRLVEVLALANASATLRVMRKGFDRLGYDATKNEIVFSGLRDGWTRTRVKHVVSHMTSGSRGWSDLIQDEGELFLQSGNIDRQMGVSSNNAPRIAPQVGAEAHRTRIRSRDTLVCITGGRTGAVGFAEHVAERSYINQHICLLRPSHEINPRLLAQILFSEVGQLQFRMAQYGLKQGLGFDEVANVSIPLPPQNEQAQISAAIEAESQQSQEASRRVIESIDRLREYRAALITAVVKGQIDVSTYGNQGTTDRTLDRIEGEMGG